MKIFTLTFFGVLILSGLNTCTNHSDKVADATLVDTEWDLQSFEIIDVEESDVGSQGILLSFKEDSTFNGRSYTIGAHLGAPGNSYGGVYEVGLDDSLSIKQTYTTYVGLPPGSRYEEYILAIKNASAYEIEGNTLHIFYDGRKNALNFKAE